VKSFSKNHIDTVVMEESGLMWRFTGIYGEYRNENKEITWKLLCTLNNQNDLPWLCSGDFNEILFNCEKEGGCPRSERSMEKFRQVLEECELHDLGFMGDAFTWRNHHHDAVNYTKERLDRAVANNVWRYCFTLVRVINGDPHHSDHMPVIVDTGDKDLNERKKPRHIMNFF
jgi:endonuclease/exonuclease/phosphatase family metal-dependent hydrolase